MIKRNGKVVPFEEDKIKVAVTKAFLANESGNAAASERIHRKVEDITADVQEVFKRRMPSGGTLHIEEIQDQVELQLMRNEEYVVARKYILYREERAAERTKDVIAIEHDPAWFKKVTAQIPGNAKVLLREADTDGEYCRTILKQEGLFNFIVIDGYDRLNCAKQALKKLAPDGCILVDDTNIEEFMPPYDFLKAEGMKYITFHGIKPTFLNAWSTTIFSQPENCLGI